MGPWVLVFKELVERARSVFLMSQWKFNLHGSKKLNGQSNQEICVDFFGTA